MMPPAEREILEASQPQQAAADLLATLDRLAERLEEAVAVVEQLRGERNSLLSAAGAGSPAALGKKIEGWLRLEEEHRVLLEERRQAAERLQGLIDKVDRLQR